MTNLRQSSSTLWPLRPHGNAFSKPSSPTRRCASSWRGRSARAPLATSPSTSWSWRMEVVPTGRRRWRRRSLIHGRLRPAGGALAAMVPARSSTGADSQLGRVQEFLPYFPFLAALLVVGGMGLSLADDPFSRLQRPRLPCRRRNSQVMIVDENLTMGRRRRSWTRTPRRCRGPRYLPVGASFLNGGPSMPALHRR